MFRARSCGIWAFHHLQQPRGIVLDKHPGKDQGMETRWDVLGESFRAHSSPLPQGLTHSPRPHQVRGMWSPEPSSTYRGQTSTGTGERCPIPSEHSTVPLQSHHKPAAVFLPINYSKQLRSSNTSSHHLPITA